jgi:hypothetical protein
MNKIAVGFLLPVTMGKFIKFIFSWATLAAVLQIAFLLFSNRSLNVVNFFCSFRSWLLFFFHTIRIGFYQHSLKVELVASFPSFACWHSHYLDFQISRRNKSKQSIGGYCYCVVSNLVDPRRSIFSDAYQLQLIEGVGHGQIQRYNCRSSRLFF